MIKRRHFLGLLGLSALGSMAPARVFGDIQKQAGEPFHPQVPRSTGAAGRVVVVGGGMGGATAAKFLRLWGGEDVQVTLVETRPDYPSSIFSNLVLNGTTTMASLTFKYDTLQKRYGVKIIRGRAGPIDPVRKTIRVGGASIPYDRLVLAPGIELDYRNLHGLDGLPPEQRPLHAWIGGPQVTALRNQIVGMPASGQVIITIPPAPYRCPPGPYERACLIADYFKRRKPGAKVIVLDANPGIVTEAHVFTRAFTETYGGIVEYYPGTAISHIDAQARTLTTNHGHFQASVLNVIPPQQAGQIVLDAGLAGSGGRAQVDVLSYESALAPSVHVIGDSAATAPQPMAGHLANAQAKVCADAIVRLLGSGTVDPSPLTNSACFSPITGQTASWLSVVFAYDPVSRTMQPVPDSIAAATAASSDHYEKMYSWFGNLMQDTFG
jgi:sulfide dehydrogenase [flavocytochrome c] flavoprotein subunit